MIDDVTLVQQLLEGDRSPRAGERARAESALAAAITAEQTHGRPAGTRPTSAAAIRPRARHSTRTVGVIAALVAATMIALVVIQLQPRMSHRELAKAPPATSSAYHSARPLPVHKVALPTAAVAGSWHLAAYLTKEGWQLHTQGPEPGHLTCPTASTCFVTGDNAKSASGPTDNDTLYVTYDGGTTWNALPVPAGVGFTSALSCTSASICAAGAQRAGQSVLLTTSDGAHQWTVQPLPSGSGWLTDLTCPTASTCAGLTLGISPDFVVTRDGGATWASHAFSGQSMGSLACPSTTRCVALGTQTGVSGQSGVVMSTTDGGLSWQAGTLPSGFSVDYLSHVTCAGEAHCYALGLISVANPGPEVMPDGGSSYSSGATILVGAVAASDDGGATWQLKPLPADVPQPQLSQISCPTARDCWVSGEEAVPEVIGTSVNGGSAVVLVTHDGGATWQKVTFVVPPGAPNDQGGDAYMSVGDIQCPSVSSCVGLGISDQGSSTTPVYTDAASLP